jgi:Kdo2-lipid IVA lauroyltransferase/acyltransferase
MMAYLQYLLVIGFSFFINLLPESWALWLGRQLGRMAFHLDREHQKVALENLYTAFGQEKPPEELRAIAKRTFQNLGMTVVEFFRIPKLDTETFKKRVEVEGVEFFNQVLNNENKTGALLLVSHFGNWELMGLVPRAHGYSVSVIAKPMKNKRVDRLVNGIREKAGLDVISTVGASRKVLRALSQNRFVGILIDQRAKRSEGVWADFFGKKAPTTPSLAVLAMRTGAPILPIFMIRDGYQKHRLLIKEPLRLTETGDVKKDVETNTEKINKTLEEMVRQYPDQWFWVHRRWERRKRAHRR